MAALLAASLLLVGCASGGEPSAEPGPERTPGAEETGPQTGESKTTESETTNLTSDGRETMAAISTYESWLSAVKERDASLACAQHAPQFTIELRERALLAREARLGDPCIDFAHLLWEDPSRVFDPVSVEATAVTAERAILAVKFDQGEQRLGETATLVKRRGRWFLADLTPRTNGAGNGQDRVETAKPAQWVRAWCDLDVEMTRAELIERMGEPSGEYTVRNGGEPQVFWTNREYDFRAYLDLDDSILELVGDYDALDAADRAELDCPELR